MRVAEKNKLAIGNHAVALHANSVNSDHARWVNASDLSLPVGVCILRRDFILINDDFGRVAKSVAVLLAGGSIALLFTPVHFLVPLAMQLTICIWLALYFQMNR
jgi:hypothetical protein